MGHSILNHLYFAFPTFRKMKKLIYSNPDCDYQRSPNAFQLKHFYVSNKDVVANANKLWKEMKNSKNKVFIFLKNTYNHILFTRSLS